MKPIALPRLSRIQKGLLNLQKLKLSLTKRRRHNDYEGNGGAESKDEKGRHQTKDQRGAWRESRGTTAATSDGGQ
jgi:hypothetical protein